MIYRTTLLSMILALAISQMPSQAATTYRYMTVCGGDICLVAVDGKTKLTLARSIKSFWWYGPAVSPDGKSAIATLCDDSRLDLAKVYAVDLADGKQRFIAGDKGYEIPEYPVWLNDRVLLLETRDKDGLDMGVWAMNFTTGASRRVVPPLPENEFFYSDLIPSPSGKLLATTMGITAGEWLSVNDLASNRQCWRTNPKQGMSGFTGMEWSADSKSLFVSFSCSDEDFYGPGELWKFDARTGKQRLWKYAGQGVSGIWASPDHRVLAVGRKNEIDYIRTSDGRLLYKASTKGLGGVIGVVFAGAGRSVICGTKLAAEVTASKKRVKTHDVRSISDDVTRVRYSDARDAIMYGAKGALDLKTGRITVFRGLDERVEWLQRDIVR
jgi:WD40 repeat protein